jgi:hypothetical protein
MPSETSDMVLLDTVRDELHYITIAPG